MAASAPRPAAGTGGTVSSGAPVAPGLRASKRRALRSRLSDTATAMFLERGFDAVRVSDVAAACGVSTKTVWNHFPTKEALLFDRGETLAAVLELASKRPTDVLAAVLECIRGEVARLEPAEVAGPSAAGHDPTVCAPAVGRDSEVLRTVQAFALLCDSHPSLRAATSDRLELLTQAAGEALAAQQGAPATSARNQIGASALVALWRVHLSALLRYADTAVPLDEIRRAVLSEVQAGADVVARLLLDGEPRPEAPAARQT